MGKVLEILLVFLAAAGLFALGWLAFGRLMLPVGEKGRSWAVVPAWGDGEALEREVQGLLWLKSSGLSRSTVIIADCGLTERGRDLALLLTQWEQQVRFCRVEELGQYIKAAPAAGGKHAPRR